MSISGLKRIIERGGNEGRAGIFLFEHSAIFTDRRILVRNDPNLREYFGDFLLDSLLKDGSAYTLGVEGSRIKFLGELLQISTKDSVKGYLEADIDKMILLDPIKKVRSRKGEKETYELPKDDVVISVVDKLYFDYLTSVGYDKIGINSVEEAYPTIYFIQDKRVRSVCMSLGP